MYFYNNELFDRLECIEDYENKLNLIYHAIPKRIEINAQDVINNICPYFKDKIELNEVDILQILLDKWSDNTSALHYVKGKRVY